MNQPSSIPPTAGTSFEYMAAGESFGPQKGVIIHMPSYNCSSYPNVFQSMNRIEQIFVPRFNGIGDFRLWVNSYSGILGLHSMKEEEKIQSLSMHLEGPALRLHKAYLAGKSGCFSWLDYVFHMSHWYDVGGTHLDISVVEWKYLTQKGNLLDYYEHFARTRVVMVCSEGFAVEYFIGGLREEYQDFVRGKLPRNVYEAYCWAYNYENFLLSLENLDNSIKSTLASTAQNSITESSQESKTRTSETELVLNGVDEDFQNVEENDYKVGSEGDQRKVQTKEAITDVQCPVEVCNSVDKEDEFLVENDQLEGQPLEPVIQIGCHEEICSKLSLSGFGFREYIGLNLSEEGMTHRVSNVGNCFDGKNEFKSSNVMEFDFIGADAYIEMQQLGVRKKCLRTYVKLVVMFGDGMKKVRNKCGNVELGSLVATFVHFSCKVLDMECGHIAKGDIQWDYIAKGDIQWDYKRYKKKVRHMVALISFPPCACSKKLEDTIAFQLLILEVKDFLRGWN